MTYDSQELKNVCIKLGITPNHHFILYSLYQKNRSLEELVYEYKQKYGKSPFSAGEVEELVRLGYLIDNNGVESILLKVDGPELATYSINLELTERFKEAFFISTELAGEELFEVYPDFMVIKGDNIPLKRGGEYNGKYYDIRKLKRLYGQTIQHDIVLHQRILRTVERAAQMQQLNVTFRSFIFDQMWNSYFKLEDNSQQNITPL